MAVDDRITRKESRVRGSGKRNVLVDDFFVLNKQSASDKSRKKRRLTDSLKSALNHWDNIESLPRLRNRKVSAIGKGDFNGDDSKTTTPVPQTSGEQEDPQIPNRSVHSVALRSEEAGELLTPSHLINQSIYDEIEYPVNHNQGESLQEENNNVMVAKSATEKTKSRRGRPKKTIRVNVGRPRKVDKPENNNDTGAKRKERSERNEVDSSADTSFRRESLRKTRKISYKETPSDNENEETSEDEKIEYAFQSLATRTLRQKSRLRQFLGGVGSPEEAETVEEPHSRIRRLRDNVEKRQKALSDSQKQDKVSNEKVLRKSKPNGRTATSDKPNSNENASGSAKAESKSRVERNGTGPQNRIERLSSRRRERAAPIPLSRKRQNERQKPMNIDIERLRDEENKDKRVKIHTIDVLRHLVKEYEPEEIGSEVIREQVVQEDFKAHLVHQLDYLMDIHSAINDITARINEVQKLKNECRQRIYALKQNHVDVGTKLNTLRSQYSRDKDRHAEVQMVENEIKSLQQIGNSTDYANSSLSQQITVALSCVSPIVNPSAGILRKLQIVNQKLVDLDRELI